MKKCQLFNVCTLMYVYLFLYMDRCTSKYFFWNILDTQLISLHVLNDLNEFGEDMHLEQNETHTV